MVLFSVRVDDELGARFDAAAARAGGRSALLRRCIQERASVGSQVPVRRPPATARLMVRLAAADAEAVGREAAAMGLRPSGWVSGLVAARLRGAARFARGEELALIAIQGEVRRIGVNLNQMARALNTAVLEGRVVELQLAAVGDLRTELQGHLTGVRRAFAGDHSYWATAW